MGPGRCDALPALDIFYLRRVYKVCALITIAAFLCAWHLLNEDLAVGILSGGFFGIINTLLLERVIDSALGSGSKDPLRISVSVLVKGPVIYGLLILVLWKRWVDPIGFVTGFGLFFLSVIIALYLNYEGAHFAGLLRERKKT